MIEQPSPSPSLQPTQPGERIRRRHRRERPFRQFIRKYSFEIIWAAVVLLGIFLIFERMNIRSTLIAWATAALAMIFRAIGHVDEAVASIIARTTLSNAIGYVLLLAALMAILLRLRWRLIRTPSLTVLSCPQCGSHIHRVHRHALDHLISRFVPVRRYRCANRDCRWHGLRVVSAAHGRQPAPARR